MTTSERAEVILYETLGRHRPLSTRCSCGHEYPHRFTEADNPLRHLAAELAAALSGVAATDESAPIGPETTS